MSDRSDIMEDLDRIGREEGCVLSKCAHAEMVKMEAQLAKAREVALRDAVEAVKTERVNPEDHYNRERAINHNATLRGAYSAILAILDHPR